MMEKRYRPEVQEGDGVH